MKKYIRAMFYGTTKTKIFLWTIAVVAFLSIVCMGICFLGGGLNFAYLGFGGIIFSVAYSQLGTFKDVTALLNNEKLLEQSIKKRKQKLDETDSNGEKRRKKSSEEEEASDNPYNKYSKEKIKNYLVAYQADQHNYRVLIDSSEKYKIKNCPALIWSDKNFLSLLLLEKKTRIIQIPRTEVTSLRYEKGVVIKDMEEYSKVKDSILGSLFEELFPKYYKTRVNGLTSFMKNLFVIGEDIRITAPSAAGMCKATKCRLELTDKQFDRTRFNSYFEEVYKANLLFKENALSCEEYEQQVREMLVNLAEHEEDIKVFQQTIGQLTQYSLISQEYAEFYMNYRGKLEEKREKG